jgi:hypothetical protein
LPTITATVHQVLRYFFVGALAAAFVAAPPGEMWKVRFASFLTEWLKTEWPKTEAAVVAIAMLIGGSLIYGAHRVVVYPWIFRFIILRVLGEETTEQGRCRWFPYGRAGSGELHLEELASRLKKRHRERFVGWASEIHLFYLAREIALFTLVWPGWRVTCPWAWALGLGVLLVLVAAWDEQAISVLADRGRNSPEPPARAVTSWLLDRLLATGYRCK